MSALDLMSLHIDALFAHDDRNRMTAVNDIDRGSAPRLFLGRTVEGNIWRFRHDLSPDLVAKLEAVLEAEPIPTDLTAEAQTFRRLHRALSRDRAVEQIWGGPAWTFLGPITLPDDINVQRVTSDWEITGERFQWLVDELEYCEPCCAILNKEGKIASLCHSSRNTPLAAEAGVETLERYRGRGYGKAVVASWARAVRAEGRTPLYSTSWDNGPSQALARSLGLTLYGSDLHMT